MEVRGTQANNYDGLKRVLQGPTDTAQTAWK